MYLNTIYVMITLIINPPFYIFSLNSRLIFLEACVASFSSVQSLSRVWLFVTPWITAHQASLSITNSRSSPKLMFPGSSDSKASAYNVGDLGSIPGSGRSPEEGNGNPLQDYCLENPITEEPGRLQSMGLQRVRHNWAISLFFTCPP